MLIGTLLIVVSVVLEASFPLCRCLSLDQRGVVIEVRSVYCINFCRCEIYDKVVFIISI